MELFELNLGDWTLKRLDDYQGPMGEIFVEKERRYKVIGTYDEVRDKIFRAGNYCIVKINGIPAFAL